MIKTLNLRLDDHRDQDRARHTVAQWDVQDIEEELRHLKACGVVFEEYDMTGVEWKNSIASIPGGRAAWFRDSEGMVMFLDERAQS